MSILGQAAGAPNAQWTELAVILPLAAVALAVAAWSGAFRRNSVLGPPRMGAREPMGLLIAILGGGILLLIMAQALCLGPLPQATPATTRAATTPALNAAERLAALTPSQMALLVSVPSLVACAFVIAANGALRDQGLRRLGLARTQLRIGIVAGALGTVVAVPLVFAVVELTQWLWQAMHYAHPSEHELLTVIGKSPSTFLKWVFVVSAVVIAPVWEEVLFRGHVQTICAYGVDRLLRYARRSTPTADLAPAPPQQGGDTPVLEYAAPVAPAPPAAPGVAERWGAIVVTSLLFAAVHEAWTAPPIFFLSLCLGYAYERTGSLWTTIVMHAAFNATSTILFLTLTR